MRQAQPRTILEQSVPRVLNLLIILHYKKFRIFDALLVRRILFVLENLNGNGGKMTLSSKQMDRAEHRVAAEDAYALKNANNNDSGNVGVRFVDLHKAGAPLPIHKDAGFVGRLLLDRNNQGKVSFRSNSDGKGIVTSLRDENGNLGEYLIEINGSFAVEVTRKL